MMNTMKTLVALLFVTLFVGVALADTPAFTTGQGSGGTASPAIDRDSTVIFCQPDYYYGGVVSFDDTGSLNRDITQVDDFTSVGDLAITRVDWSGIYQLAPACVDAFVITVYGYIDCAGPDESTIIATQTVTDFNETFDQSITYDFYTYSAAVDPIPMASGGHYWISIVAVVDTEVCGDWYWAASDQFNECDNMLKGDYWGVPDWATVTSLTGDPGYRASAFCLYGDDTIATEHSSWSSVKGLFE